MRTRMSWIPSCWWRSKNCPVILYTKFYNYFPFRLRIAASTQQSSESIDDEGSSGDDVPVSEEERRKRIDLMKYHTQIPLTLPLSLQNDVGNSNGVARRIIVSSRQLNWHASLYRKRTTMMRMMMMRPKEPRALERLPPPKVPEVMPAAAVRYKSNRVQRQPHPRPPVKPASAAPPKWIWSHLTTN